MSVHLLSWYTSLLFPLKVKIHSNSIFVRANLQPMENRSPLCLFALLSFHERRYCPILYLLNCGWDALHHPRPSIIWCFNLMSHNRHPSRPEASMRCLWYSSTIPIYPITIIYIIIYATPTTRVVCLQILIKLINFMNKGKFIKF